MLQKVHFGTCLYIHFSKDLEYQAFVLGGHLWADSRTIKCFNQSPAGSQASSQQNDQIDLLCFTEVRAELGRDMG